ncbi:putative ABC transporter permease [Anaerocolumna jejuensis]|uniref:putative ABC transporter permease n=1 Tax=Anaerocolumna jejuensis TaxID=259063 RepID=UPI003F7CBCDB
MKKLFRALFLWAIGGSIYYAIEVLWRGHSHWAMFILGGLCFLLIGALNELYTWDMALISQMFISSLIITLLELITGLIVNIGLGWGVWDYSRMPYNFYGQICLLYTVLWFFLSLAGIILDDFIRWKWLGEEKPHYKIL